MNIKPYNYANIAPWNEEDRTIAKAHEQAITDIVELVGSALPMIQPQLRSIFQKMVMTTTGLSHVHAGVRNLIELKYPNVSGEHAFNVDTPHRQSVQQWVESTLFPSRWPQAAISPLSFQWETLELAEAREPRVEGQVETFYEYYRDILNAAMEAGKAALLVRRTSHFVSDNRFEDVILIPVTATQAFVLLPQRQEWTFLFLSEASDKDIVIAPYTAFDLFEHREQQWKRACSNFLDSLPMPLSEVIQGTAEDMSSMWDDLANNLEEIQALQATKQVKESFLVDLSSKPAREATDKFAVKLDQHEALGTFLVINNQVGQFALSTQLPTVYQMRQVEERWELEPIDPKHLNAVSVLRLCEITHAVKYRLEVMVVVGEESFSASETGLIGSHKDELADPAAVVSHLLEGPQDPQAASGPGQRRFRHGNSKHIKHTH